MGKETIIKYTIDTIEYENDLVILRGWAYDCKNENIVDISLIGEESKGVILNREQRTEVNQFLGVDLEKKLGFIIKFEKRWQNKKVKLKLISSDSYLIKKVRLKENRNNKGLLLKSKAEFGIQKIRWGFDYLDQNGIKKTFGRLKTEIFSN